MPVIVRVMNATKEMPPRQYSGYQYQIVFSSYFSAWERGTCRCTVSTVRRVRSDQGVGGNREARYPNTFRYIRPIRDSRGMRHLQYAKYQSRNTAARLPRSRVTTSAGASGGAAANLLPRISPPQSSIDTAGIPRVAGPWAMFAPTYRVPFGWTSQTSVTGSYWELWHRHQIGSSPARNVRGTRAAS